MNSHDSDNPAHAKNKVHYAVNTGKEIEQHLRTRERTVKRHHIEAAVLLIVLVAFLLLYKNNSKIDKLKLKEQMPEYQKAFVELLTKTGDDFSTLSPDADGQEKMRYERTAALAKLIERNGNKLTDWFGEVVDAELDQDGLSYIVISISQAVNIVAYVNDLKSPLRDFIKSGRKNELVVFSGSFVLGYRDYVKEESLTMFGSMRYPRFTIDISAIRSTE